MILSGDPPSSASARSPLPGHNHGHLLIEIQNAQQIRDRLLLNGCHRLFPAELAALGAGRNISDALP